MARHPGALAGGQIWPVSGHDFMVTRPVVKLTGNSAGTCTCLFEKAGYLELKPAPVGLLLPLPPLPKFIKIVGSGKTLMLQAFTLPLHHSHHSHTPPAFTFYACIVVLTSLNYGVCIFAFLYIFVREWWEPWSGGQNPYYIRLVGSQHLWERYWERYWVLVPKTKTAPSWRCWNSILRICIYVSAL